jgi:hypothetical protein
MLTRLSNWFYKISSGWVTLFFLTVFIAFTTLVLPGQASQAEESSGGGFSPDTSFFYTPDQLYEAAQAYGPDGRQAYIRARYTFDIAWPLVYTAFLTSTVSWLLGRGISPGSRWRLLNLTPLAGMLLDLLENSATSLVMYRFPAESVLLGWLAALFTLLKWVFVGGAFVVLVVGIVLALRGILRRKTLAPLE